MPLGVTLEQINGGPNYYGDQGLTYAHNAGWDSPSFFPIGPFLASLVTRSDAARWLDVGWNTAFTLTSDSHLSVARSNTIWVIQNMQERLIPGTGVETVGLMSYDEPNTFARGVSGPIGGTTNRVQDGRFWWLNNTWKFIHFGALNGTPAPKTAATDLNYLVATPDGSLRHIDIQSVDMYWFAVLNLIGVYLTKVLSFTISAPLRLMPLLGSLRRFECRLWIAMTVDQGARGNHYGDMVDRIRAFQTMYPAPIFQIVENGGPYRENTSASYYITSPELNWAVWSSIIHGARGIVYFNHSFAGPATS